MYRVLNRYIVDEVMGELLFVGSVSSYYVDIYRNRYDRISYVFYIMVSLYTRKETLSLIVES